MLLPISPLQENLQGTPHSYRITDSYSILILSKKPFLMFLSLLIGVPSEIPTVCITYD